MTSSLARSPQSRWVHRFPPRMTLQGKPFSSWTPMPTRMSHSTSSELLRLCSGSSSPMPRSPRSRRWPENGVRVETMTPCASLNGFPRLIGWTLTASATSRPRRPFGLARSYATSDVPLCHTTRMRPILSHVTHRNKRKRKETKRNKTSCNQLIITRSGIPAHGSRQTADTKINRRRWASYPYRSGRR